MNKIGFESAASQNYINILQSTISRMASNSASNKTWCITLVSAILVLTVDKKSSNYIWIAMFPILVFLLLDAYYLGLERRFRVLYSDFIQKLHSDTAITSDVYIMNPGAGLKITFPATIRALLSFSIWPFYLMTGAMVIVFRFFFC